MASDASRYNVIGRNASSRAMLPLLCAVLFGGCAGTAVTGGGKGTDAERSRQLEQLARSVMTDSGHVSVQVDGDVAFVHGFVKSAIDQKRILQTLESTDGIREVRNGLLREM